MSPRWSITALEDMPTLRQTRTDDLKFDNGTVRVWLSRTDGPERPRVTVETRRDDGSWQPSSS